MLKRKLCSMGISVLKVLPLGFLLVACGANFSPNTYSSSAVQKASKVDLGVVVGVRKVAISVDSSLAAATGAAAGGIGGSQVADGAVSALGALGGAVVGGLAGSEVGHKVQDTYGYEYIVRKVDGDLLSVTQKDKVPLKVGQRVLLIQGTEARIVKDYTQPVQTEASASKSGPQSPQPPQSPTPVVQTPTAQTPVAEPSTVSVENKPVPSPAASAPAETPSVVEATGDGGVSATSASVVSNVTVIPVDTEPQGSAQATATSTAEPASSTPENVVPKETRVISAELQDDAPAPSAVTSTGSLTHGPGTAH